MKMWSDPKMNCFWESSVDPRQSANQDISWLSRIYKALKDNALFGLPATLLFGE